ncbi:MAG: SLATT domain-containing protein [Chloroflexi bacterium]|nr:SLATT domain-containing protein [Chloroflexota bacterium]
MIEDHFPEFYRKADGHSRTWQKWYLWSERVQLISLLIPAGLASFWNPGPLLVVLSFAVATLAHIFRLATSADEKWWNGRAGAESAKTISWKFVVGGDPFAVDNRQGEVELATRLAEIASKVAKLVPVSVSQSPATDEMKAVRHQSLDKRVSLYLNERIRAQMAWYSSKSDVSLAQGTCWSLAAIAAQAAALVLGIVGATNDWSFDFVGVFSAAAASAVAWMAVKQFEVLGRSYAVASNELSSIEARINSQPWEERSWAAFVNEAEEAISREHTSWQASRAV